MTFDSTTPTPADSHLHRRAASWQLKATRLDFSAGPVLMGIVNVTPDSFSDGGEFASTNAAIQRAWELVEAGAGLIDIGGESTRPYAEPVEATEELRRVIPVIQQLAPDLPVPISIDTSKAIVARQALQHGAEIINDVTALTGAPDTVQVARETKAGICAMHAQGTPQTMQDNPTYRDVVTDVYDYLRQRKQSLLEQGIEAERICLDPGIGFGKTHEHNVELLRHIGQFHRLGTPILVGHSRKGFIKKATQDDSPQCLAGTLAVTLHVARFGIQVIRVHDVAEMARALALQRVLARHDPLPAATGPEDG